MGGFGSGRPSGSGRHTVTRAKDDLHLMVPQRVGHEHFEPEPQPFREADAATGR